MAGLVSSAVVAVSVTVGAAVPAAPVLKTSFETPAATTLAQAVELWSAQAGIAAPAVDHRVAGYQVGKMNLKAASACDAAQILANALRHAAVRPVVSCGHDGAISVAGAARHAELTHVVK